MKSYLLCYFCRKRKKNEVGTKRKVQAFLKGKHKLKNEFDLVNILSLIREHKLIKRVLFSKDERFLMKISKFAVLESQSSSEEDEHLKLHDFNPINMHVKRENLNNRLEQIVSSAQSS
mmetsp:Transcript_15348/g.11160  ORF Transcript_15348/g.11160 Transcript_15348/m.11160 type:complete len:118 (+) Transcript_15348:103-456(+)